MNQQFISRLSCWLKLMMLFQHEYLKEPAKVDPKEEREKDGSLSSHQTSMHHRSTSDLTLMVNSFHLLMNYHLAEMTRDTGPNKYKSWIRS